MAEEFKLSPEEAVILRIGKIGYGGGLLPSMFNSNELILTNQNLILLKKNMFGQTEETKYFPLKDIKTANGIPQVRKSNPEHMVHALDVYFNNGIESFRFEWEKDIDEWVDNIIATVTGIPVKKKSDFEEMAEFVAFAESMTEPIEKIQSARLTGKTHFMVVVAEGAGSAAEVGEYIRENLGLDPRVTVLGHIQRGGSPNARDRVTATQMGHHAVELLANGMTNRVVCTIADGEISDVDISTGLAMHKGINQQQVEALRAMTGL